MKTTHLRRSTRQFGGLLVVLMFGLIIASALLMGAGTLTASYFSRTLADADYAAALDAAEAGANKELQIVSANASNADAYPGHAYSTSTGSATVWCENEDGSRPWNGGKDLFIVSEGVVDGVKRSIRIGAQGEKSEGDFAIYTMEATSVFDGGAMDINGDMGSNGIFDFAGSPNVSGDIYFNGSGAGWADPGDGNGYTTHTSSAALQFKTVSQIADEKFGANGLAYVATHNSNALANPPIMGNSITSSTTLVGPGDYYVTNMVLTGNKKITLDNTLGPVNIWVGPAGGTSTCIFRGGTAAISPVSDTAKMNFIYVATYTGIEIAGNETLDASIWAYNKNWAGQGYGYVRNSGNPTVNGQILAHHAQINGNITINYVDAGIEHLGYLRYVFSGDWEELSGR